MQINNLFWQRLEKIYDKTDVEIIKYSLNIKKRPVSFRVNTIKSSDSEIEKVLEEKNITYKKIEFIPNCYILENAMEKDLWELDIFKAGKIYLQSISSQIPPLFLDLKENDKVLDITAAPGSKTSQMATILKNNGEIIANDNNAIRIDKLKFTLERQGIKNTKVIKNDARDLGKIYKEETFDKILADLPCSAEGRINFNEEKSFGFWSEENIKKNYKLQKEILQNTVKLLKKGGTLVYSTCTIAPEENEAIVHFLLSNFKDLEIIDIGIDNEYLRPGIKGFNGQVYNKNVTKSIRCLPSYETEGFFIAKFRRK